jgi:AAA domain, putative AbiEii toxin, Type IV TA system
LSNENQPRLLSFTLDGWDVLGGRVSVSLSDRVAMLVGQNGAGKSAILEGFEAIALCALGETGTNAFQLRHYGINGTPKILDIKILTPTNRQLNYHYELIFPSESSLSESVSWSDCCQYIDKSRETLWSTEMGLTTFEHGTTPVLIGVTSSFGQRPNLMKNVKAPVEMQWISMILKGINMIGEMANQVFKRRSSHIITLNGYIDIESCLADKLSLKILKLDKHGKLNELENICQRMGLGNEIVVRKVVNGENSRDNREDYVASVLLDGVNIGLLSDGTLRILSILMEIVNSNSVSTIIIEEPEMQIHPGMLRKLLNEIEAYTFGENLIISTHSPQVVSWAKPNQINLVYRNNGQTFTRKLGADEIHRVVEYLNEEGDLGEWIYSGMLDE